MRPTLALCPQDVLRDDQDETILGGVEVRKGTVAAFVANAKLLQSVSPTDPDYEMIRQQLRELAPAVRAVGLLEIFSPRSAEIDDIFTEVT
ncbi:hypothetical protein MMAD_28100 [Mycolicibacterium madagascariense]|uniref:Uncharacterized protein n=1 Tax=Mycolicibacterium madagascariense TaxID=212765 RepID=A0A7I7XHE6_9MYCO|nr:hypothetical protein [Mycolicibacterium madagascariense]MCV7014392.1 hypothetical protein [Mycolicibacterium madagascariense]BBZ28515.1 hypothetical protein MMAD_28100 [Mycolicibacterium madagascariense]